LEWLEPESFGTTIYCEGIGMGKKNTTYSRAHPLFSMTSGL